MRFFRKPRFSDYADQYVDRTENRAKTAYDAAWKRWRLRRNVLFGFGVAVAVALTWVLVDRL